MRSLVFASIFALPFVAYAAETRLMEISKLAGSLGGVAESCDYRVGLFVDRVTDMLENQAASKGAAAELVKHFREEMAETKKIEYMSRTIDCGDFLRKWEELWINRPNWNVEKGWSSRGQ